MAGDRRVASCGVLAKHGLVWTLLVALCVQGGAAAISALRGPAHVHAAAPAHDPAASRRAGHFDSVLALAAGHAQTSGFPRRAHDHAHHHGDVQHHYHGPGGDVVLVGDDVSTKGAEHATRGESGSAAFLALISEGVVHWPADAKAGFAIPPARELLSYIADRIERPPRPLST